MRIATITVLALLAGCAQEPTPAEREAATQQDIAAVEQANSAPPPMREVTPEAIGYPDMERHGMMGRSCSYAPGTSLGARVIARAEDAFMKIGGEVVRLGADSGAAMLPANTRSRYIGGAYELQLELAGSGEPTAGDKRDYDGTLILRDQYGRIVYQGSGIAQCDG